MRRRVEFYFCSGGTKKRTMRREKDGNSVEGVV